MRADPQTEQAVNQSLDKLFAAYSSGDTDEAMRRMVSDDDVTLFEPRPDSIYVGQDAVRGGIQFDYDTTDGDMPIEVRRRWTSARGDVAWTSAELEINVTHQGRNMTLEGRFTGVAIRESGDWRWHTLHFAAADPRVGAGQAWPTLSGGTGMEAR